MNLPTLPADKANHVVYGATIFCALMLLMRGLVQALDPVLGLTWLPHAAAALALAIVAVIGIAKEVADRLANLRAKRLGLLQPHGVELLDAVATVYGAVLCWLACMVGVP